MKNQIIILFEYSNKYFSFEANAQKSLKKNFSKVILYKNYFKNKLEDRRYNEKKLNDIRNHYKKLKIDLCLNKIYEINSFLKEIKTKEKNKKIFICQYSMFFSDYSEETLIFYELSKIYEMQFLKPERSFIKNRYILAKNIFRHHYILKKKKVILKKKFKIFKINYISSMEGFKNNLISQQKKKVFYFNKILLNILKLIFNFRFNEKPKKYALVVMGNSEKLDSISEPTNLIYFINRFLRNFNYELVFLVHPNTNVIKFFFQNIIKKNYSFFNDRIIFLQKPKKLINIIQNSKFIIHLSSSLSPQSILLKKKILCLGKNTPYIGIFNNLVLNFQQNGFNNIKKKINKKDVLNMDKFLINLLSNSVNYKGEHNLYVNKDHYSSQLKITHTREKIVQNLLCSI
jgi:hypothetical protein